ncbi:DivIVA domain-containing protein [Aliifodinibius sp. S!AR15-10]|uniref:DivIVA domain-containing protein n=1 Tax=Aliifodinibius sp. S!AR15-10 TaxID=2950437 RepID=UPI0028563A15|nr:DivIVA domain-containing protein [Aliifodinibius sp. S!AR15-10]MDR8393475.1 DivIVA domain-containing protein [Aliifodinibius sp. S!AR15-10]
MKLTALEIKQQSFEKSFRGYEKAEVDAFLNLVSNEWEHLVGKNRDLEKRIEELEEKLKHYERVEEALHETLQTAKESAENKLTGARKEAKNKIEKAEMEAESIVREAIQQRQQIRQSILRLLDRRKEIVGGIRSYLELAQESLDQFAKDEADLFDMPEDNEFDNHFKKQIQNRKQKYSEDYPEEDDEAQTMPPGAEDVDDIIDELD